MTWRRDADHFAPDFCTTSAVAAAGVFPPGEILEFCTDDAFKVACGWTPVLSYAHAKWQGAPISTLTEAGWR
jgi:hypothetical protein